MVGLLVGRLRMIYIRRLTAFIYFSLWHDPCVLSTAPRRLLLLIHETRVNTSHEQVLKNFERNEWVNDRKGKSLRVWRSEQKKYTHSARVRARASKHMVEAQVQNRWLTTCVNNAKITNAQAAGVKVVPMMGNNQTFESQAIVKLLTISVTWRLIPSRPTPAYSTLLKESTQVFWHGSLF